MLGVEALCVHTFIPFQSRVTLHNGKKPRFDLHLWEGDSVLAQVSKSPDDFLFLIPLQLRLGLLSKDHQLRLLAI